MEYFLQCGVKIVPIGKFSNKAGALSELQKGKYQEFIRKNIRGGSDFLIKRKIRKRKEGQNGKIIILKAPLNIKKSGSSFKIKISGKFEQDSNPKKTREVGKKEECITVSGVGVVGSSIKPAKIRARR